MTLLSKLEINLKKVTKFCPNLFTTYNISTTKLYNFDYTILKCFLSTVIHHN